MFSITRFLSLICLDSSKRGPAQPQLDFFVKNQDDMKFKKTKHGMTSKIYFTLFCFFLLKNPSNVTQIRASFEKRAR